MARKWGLFRRFRLVAVPGAAGIAGVPANREAVLREELAPIFASLRAVEQTADDVVARARVDGDARRAHATEEAQGILEDAHCREASERAVAAQDLASSARTDARKIRASADEEAQRIARRAAERIPAMMSELVARVMATGSSEEVAK